MRKLLPAITAIAICFGACTKEPVFSDPRPNTNNDGNNYTCINVKPDTTPAVKEGTIPLLIDASKDGGAWWFPQTGSFTPTDPHQGLAFAKYLRSMGFRVVEVPRGQTITWSFLSQFHNVIRYGGYGTYTQAEIDAYDSLAAHSANILFLEDYVRDIPYDLLSSHWGLNFSGVVGGNITEFAEHPVTAGVSSLYYGVGSVITNPDLKKITVLGSFAGTEPQQVALGILHHPTAKIVFMGDCNTIEWLPQPFTGNLVHWLFN